MVDLFFSYSHKDEALRDELEKHLSILRRQGVLNTCHDRRIEAGSEIHTEINGYMLRANIILLLISSDFLSSDYCYDKEMQLAMERHNKKEAVVIPVILRPCDWQDAPFGKLLAIPKDGKPVTKFATTDEAFLEITTEIKRVANTIHSKGGLSKPISTVFQTSGDSTSNMIATTYRSSNLSVAKKFSDHEKDLFLEQAFEYIANFFEASLKELSARNAEIKYNYKRIDALSFSVVIYKSGEKKSECGIYYGGSISKGINYSRNLPISRSMLNDSLTIESNENILGLKPIGFTIMNRSDGPLTYEGASEYYWQILMEPLQRTY